MILSLRLASISASANARGRADIRSDGNAAGSKALAKIAQRHGATPAQVAIAWLLARSPVMVPIPGTSSSLAHLEENVAAAQVMLSEEERSEWA